MRKLFTIISAIWFTAVLGQGESVFIDGRFGDWTENAQTHNDLVGDGNQIDILGLSVTNDQNNLYLKLELYEKGLLNDNNQLVLLIDTDGDASTGFKKNGIGAELVWNFGTRKGSFYGPEGQSNIWHNHIGFRALPTVTSETFEMALSRSQKPNGDTPLFMADSLRVVIYDGATGGDQVPENGEFITYYFNNELENTMPELSIKRDSPAHLRLMTYNVLHDGIMDADRGESIRRIVEAVNPDIITFNECWDTEANYVVQWLNTNLPLDGNKSWYVSKVVYGNITASKYPIVDNVNVLPGKRIAASLIDLPERFMKDIMVINCHLKCCGSESDNDTRQYESDAIISFINDTKAGENQLNISENTPFVFMGDFNLVGDAQQQYTLTHGDIVNTTYFGNGGLPDWDDTPMADLISQSINFNMAYTWRSDKSSYWPGRLDYIFYTNSQMKAQKSFILETRYMSSDSLLAHNLKSYDSRTASDHFPHIADFTLEETVDVSGNKAMDIDVFPNPAHQFIEIKLNKVGRHSNLQLIDLNGKVWYQSKAKDTTVINTQGLKNGVYLIRYLSEDWDIAKKIIISPN